MIYSINKNNYRKNKKDSTIYTPEKVSSYLYSLLIEHISPKVILDPAIGQGSLTTPWKKDDCEIIGVDIDGVGKNYCDKFIHGKFEDIDRWEYKKPEFVIVNPPFNGASGRKLYPEIFLRQIVKLFGNKIPIAMIAPMGVRLNVRQNSRRWTWIKDNLEISSIVSLPIDCFGLKFHTEVLIFNVSSLNGHYFLEQEIKKAG